MVHLFPKNFNLLIKEGAPKSERIFFKIFKCLNNEWYVWHSVEWMEKRKGQPLLLGESDFLVFNPQFGYLILEVKGGSIKRRLISSIRTYPQNTFNDNILDDVEAEWSRDYYDEKGNFIQNKPLKDNPFKQARKSMFYFLRFYADYINSLKKRIDNEIYAKLFPKNCFPGNFNCGVILPDCILKKKNTSPIREFIENMIFDASDMKAQTEWEKKSSYQRSTESPLEKYLKYLFSVFKKRYPPPELKDFFINMINYTIQTNICLNSWLEDQQHILEEINKIQDYTMDLFECKKRCLFSGSAGTGKTFIAMKKLIREYRKGHKTLFLCYNRKLNEFVNNYVETRYNQAFKKKTAEYKITTINGFFHSIARKNLPEDKVKFFEEQINRQQFNEVAKIVSNILKTHIDDTYKYDSIIVDEGQDIKNEFWPIIHLLLKYEKTSVYYVFYDQAQLKFNKDFNPAKIGFDLNSDRFELTKNLRNADEIIHWVQNETKMGDYKEFLGISSIKQDFKPEHSDTLKGALKKAIVQIYELHQFSLINPEKFTILCDKIFLYLPKENYKINKRTHENITYLEQEYGLTNRFTKEKVKYYITETKTIDDLKKLRKKILNKIFISFNGIGTFKGLENDIILLIFQKPDKNNRDQFERYLRDIYIGASRAKFLLYTYTYSKI